MREIRISTEVFAKIWSLRRKGEDCENEILQRVLFSRHDDILRVNVSPASRKSGLTDARSGVIFEEGFKIERHYKGTTYRARIVSGQWQLVGAETRHSSLNELSRAIGTKTENAWVNWYFLSENGRRTLVSELRDSTRIQKREKTPREQTQVTNVSFQTRWCDDVRQALENLSGVAPLDKIYSEVAKIRGNAGRPLPPSFEAIIRKELEVRSSDSETYNAERGEDWFEIKGYKGQGSWGLRAKQ